MANISNNIIGSSTGNSAISISTLSGASSSLSRGIYVNASSNTIIAHNTIGSVAISGASNYSHSFEAISKSATSGNITIEYNAIGSPSSNNSIEITSSASSSTSSQGLYAIYNRGTGSSIIRYNSIARISNLYAGNNSGLITAGIYCSAGTQQIENNTISNISTASAQTGTTNSASLIGNEFSTINIDSSTTFPTEIVLQVRIGKTPSWKSNAIKRIYSVSQTGALDCMATISVHYVDNELNGNNEDLLVHYTDGIIDSQDIGTYQWGKSNYNKENNWVSMTDVDLAGFPSSLNLLETSLGND